MALNLINHIASVHPFLESIRTMESPKPSLLPLRGRGNPPAWVTEVAVRKLNEKLYSKLRQTFAEQHVFSEVPFEAGIYFFYSFSNRSPDFYYIGIADSLTRRLQEHLRRLDFTFFSLAFPDRATTYREEGLEFYASQKYTGHREEYERQFNARIKPGIQFIGWLSSSDLALPDWDELETHFVHELRPAVNVAKLDTPPNEQFRPLYRVVSSYLLERCEAVRDG